MAEHRSIVERIGGTDMTNSRTYVVGGRVITPYRILPRAGFVIDGSKIAALFSMDGFEMDPGAEIIDVNGAYIAPGFIDMHVHGGGGADVMDGTPESMTTIAECHAKGGATGIVPTTLTCPHQDLDSAIQAFERAPKTSPKGAKLLGLHLEGPYFSQSQRGAQDPEYIRNPVPEEYLPILDSSQSIVRVSAAPELPGALDLGRELRRRGILASIGHTDATYDDVVTALEAGYTHMTHLYSGMSSVRRTRAYRVAGAVEAGLLMDDLTVEIIADGKHLPASLLKLIYKAKGPGRIALCSDALRASGMPQGECILGSVSNGQRAIVDDGVAWLPDRTAFAGSVATANWLVRNMIQLAGVAVADAVRMASLTPARILGIDASKGSLDVGKDADIVVFDDDINVKMTIVEGNTVYRNL